MSLLFGSDLGIIERECTACGTHIHAEDRALQVERDRTHPCRHSYRHTVCPSPYWAGPLAQAWAEAPDVLAAMRKAWRGAPPGERRELAAVGRMLKAAIRDQHRLVAASMVLAWRELRAQGEVTAEPWPGPGGWRAGEPGAGR